MPDVFVSYSRRDSEFVDRLSDALEAHGKSVWLDRTDIADGEIFTAEIRRSIGSSDAFVFVISEASAESPFCSTEVEYAASVSKRIVPLLREAPAAELPDAIRERSWIPFEDDGAFDSSVERVVAALDTDLEHRRAHSRLLTKALDWEHAGRDRSFLLRGSELRAAEGWLAAGTFRGAMSAAEGGADPAERTESAPRGERPTEEQYRFISASRRDAARRSRMAFTTIGVALVVAIAATVVALFQRQQAISQRAVALLALRQSQSAEMADEAQELLSSDTPVGIELALEAYRRYPTDQARDVLAQAAQKRLLDTFAAGKTITQVVYSPDGSLLAATESGDMLILNSRSGRLLRSWKGGSFLYREEWDPDGRTIAAGGKYGALFLYDVGSGSRRVIQVASSEDSVDGLAFSPDGRSLATGTYSGHIAVWDLATGRRIWSEYSSQNNDVDAIAFSPSGSWVVTGDFGREGRSPFILGNVGHLQEWDAKTGARRAHWLDETGAVTNVQFSPDGSTIAYGDSGGYLVLRDVLTGVERRYLDGAAVNVDYSPDGLTIATGDYNGRVALWNVATGAVIADYDEGAQSPLPAFSPDGQELATTPRGEGIVVWDVQEIDGPGGTAIPAFSPDGREIASGDNRGLSIWDAATGQLLSLRGGPGQVSEASWSASGGLIATVDAAGSLIGSNGRGSGVSIWDLASRRRVEYGQPATNFIAFSPDGRRLVSSDQSGAVTLWNLANGQHENLGVDQQIATGVAFSPDGNTVAYADYDGTIVLRNVTTGAKKEFVDSRVVPLNVVAFSPDGKILAAGDQGGGVTLWDVAGSSRIAKWDDGQDITYLAWSPVADILAISDATGDVTIWDVVTGVKSTVNVGLPTLTFAVFSPSGTLLAVDNGQVRLYPTSTWALDATVTETTLCRALGGTTLTSAEIARYIPAGSYQQTCP